MPIISKKMLEILAPMMDPVCFKKGRLFIINEDEKATSSERTITIVEWPKEKKRPTASGFLPS